MEIYIDEKFLLEFMILKPEDSLIPSREQQTWNEILYYLLDEERDHYHTVEGMKLTRDDLTRIIQEMMGSNFLEESLANGSKTKYGDLKGCIKAIENPFVVFLLSPDRLPNKYHEQGFLVLRAKDLFAKWELASGEHTEQLFEGKKNPQLTNWKDLGRFALPCNHILIQDNYIQEDSAIEVVAALTAEGVEDICLTLVYSDKKKYTLEPQKMKEKLRKGLKKKKPGVRYQISVIQNTANSEFKASTHSRQVVTNSQRIKSDHSFNLFHTIERSGRLVKNRYNKNVELNFQGLMNLSYYSNLENPMRTLKSMHQAAREDTTAGEFQQPLFSFF